MAVTCDGILARRWTFPGSESDQRIIRSGSRTIWGRGACTGWRGSLTSASPPPRTALYLDPAAAGTTSTPRSCATPTPRPPRALARPSRLPRRGRQPAGQRSPGRTRRRYRRRGARRTVRGAPQPRSAAARDAAVRQRLIEHLQGLIDGSDAWPKRKRDEFVGSLRNKLGLRSLLRCTRPGCCASTARATGIPLRRQVAAAHLRPHLTAEDLAAAYKQLIAVERGWRDCKSSLGLRPVYHHREDRIRAHVILSARTASHPRGRNPHRRHLAQPAPRTRPHAPGHPRHGRRPRRPTLGPHRRPEDHPRRARPTRTAQVPRLHTLRSPRGRLTAPPTPRGCSNTTQTGSSRVCTGQRRNPAIRVPTICGSQASGMGAGRTGLRLRGRGSRRYRQGCPRCRADSSRTTPGWTPPGRRLGLAALPADAMHVEGPDAGEGLVAGRAVRGVGSSPPAVTAGRRRWHYADDSRQRWLI